MHSRFGQSFSQSFPCRQVVSITLRELSCRWYSELRVTEPIPFRYRFPSQKLKMEKSSIGIPQNFQNYFWVFMGFRFCGFFWVLILWVFLFADFVGFCGFKIFFFKFDKVTHKNRNYPPKLFMGSKICQNQLNSQNVRVFVIICVFFHGLPTFEKILFIFVERNGPSSTPGDLSLSESFKLAF